MNLQNNFTKMDKFLQEHLKIWDYKIRGIFQTTWKKQQHRQAQDMQLHRTIFMHRNNKQM